MSEWPTQVVDTVDGVVEVVRDKAVRPIQTVGRGIVYGLLAAFFFITAFTVLAVGGFRALVVYLPEDVWAAHLIVGGILTLSGLFLWTRRS